MTGAEFKAKLERGTATWENFSDAVSAWHDDPAYRGPLHEYLSLTEDDYFDLLKHGIPYMKVLNQKYRTKVAGSYLRKVEERKG